MVKEFLSQRQVSYVLMNLNQNPEAVTSFLKQGYLLPPVTVIDGVAVSGFDPERLDLLLQDGLERERDPSLEPKEPVPMEENRFGPS